MFSIRHKLTYPTSIQNAFVLYLCCTYVAPKFLYFIFGVAVISVEFCVVVEGASFQYTIKYPTSVQNAFILYLYCTHMAHNREKVLKGNIVPKLLYFIFVLHSHGSYSREGSVLVLENVTQYFCLFFSNFFIC